MHTAAVSEASCDHPEVLPLRAVDPLPHHPRRVLVAGCSGAGKSTVAAALADRLGIPYHELDALRHGPGWVPRAEFAADVAAFAATECWITEWQGAAVRPLLLARADLVVWLDLPRRRVFGQLLRRTVRRRVRRIELWNGNVEPPLWTVVTDPEHVLRWACRPTGAISAACGSCLPTARLRRWSGSAAAVRCGAGWPRSSAGVRGRSARGRAAGSARSSDPG